jgi:hypothetical protein
MLEHSIKKARPEDPEPPFVTLLNQVMELTMDFKLLVIFFNQLKISTNPFLMLIYTLLLVSLPLQFVVDLK